MTETLIHGRFLRGSIVGLLALFGFATARVFSEVYIADMVRFRVVASPQPLWQLGLFVLAGVLAGLWFSRAAEPILRERAAALLPLLLLLPVLCFDISLWSVCAYAFSAAWSVCRLAGIAATAPCNGKGWNTVLPWILLALTVLFIAQGVYASVLARRGMWLLGSDWMTYVEGCYNTWNGRILRHDWPTEGFSAGHFMPAFMLFFAPVFGLFPYAMTVFVVNALLLFGSAGLVYFCARKYRLSPAYAAAAGLVYLLYPSISNMNLCLFYGFNGLYFFIPLFVLFFWCYGTKKYKSALALMICMMLIKETVGIFFAGWGFVLLCGGRWRFGLLSSVLGVSVFFLAHRVFFPAGSSGEYMFYGQYQALGSSVPEIMLSPFLRPAAFWGQLLTWKNLLFMLLLLLPIFPAGWGRPYLWVAGWGILGFNFLRGSAEIVNIVQQYQTENVIYLAMLALYGIKCPPARWIKILRYPAKTPFSRRAARRMLACGTLASAGVLHFFCGESFYGANTLSFIRKMPDTRPVKEALYERVPAGATVQTTERCAPFFVFRNRAYRDMVPETEYVFYDLSDGLSQLFDLHEKMLRNKEFGLIWRTRLQSHNFYLFKRGAKTEVTPPPLAPFAAGDEVSLRSGAAIAEVKAALEENAVRISVRRKGALDGWLALRVMLGDDERMESWVIPFGDGLILPGTESAGGWFTTRIPITYPISVFSCTAGIARSN